MKAYLLKLDHFVPNDFRGQEQGETEDNGDCVVAADANVDVIGSMIFQINPSGMDSLTVVCTSGGCALHESQSTDIERFSDRAKRRTKSKVDEELQNYLKLANFPQELVPCDKWNFKSVMSSINVYEISKNDNMTMYVYEMITVVERIERDVGYDKYTKSATAESGNDSIRGDAVAHVLGPERGGRVRGLGFGSTLTRVDAQLQSNVKDTSSSSRLLLSGTEYEMGSGAFGSQSVDNSREQVKSGSPKPIHTIRNSPEEMVSSNEFENQSCMAPKSLQDSKWEAERKKIFDEVGSIGEEDEEEDELEDEEFYEDEVGHLVEENIPTADTLMMEVETNKNQLKRKVMEVDEEASMRAARGGSMQLDHPSILGEEVDADKNDGGGQFLAKNCHHRLLGKTLAISSSSSPPPLSS
ncbi:hypothetical protein L1049_001725 [Liquidambar formosana]|uniref:Uncharacterized protein n=1 Tax=Liquidambar formosana TaxID=63359 RepID=A0AAP0N197_LIQFO